jgi:hypothetical protein
MKLRDMTDAQVEARILHLRRRLERTLAKRDEAAGRGDDRAAARLSGLAEWVRPQLASAEQEKRDRERYPSLRRP